MNRISSELMRIAKELVGSNNFKVGDFLEASWGYGQTNITYYQILDVLPKSIRVQSVKNKIVKSTGTEDYVVPIPNAFKGKVLTRRTGSLAMSKYIKIESYILAEVWDGRPKAQTDPRCGH